MSEQFRVYFKDEADAADAARWLLALRVDGRVALYVRQEGEGLFVGCDTLWELPDDTMLTVADSDRRVPFFGMFYRIAGLKSGMHHRHGMLWVRHPDKRHRIHEVRVPLTVIAPTILKMLRGPPAGVHARRGLAPESLIARPVVGVDIDATSGYSLST